MAGELGDLLGDGVADGLGSVAGRRGAGVGSGRFVVAFRWGQVQQHRIAGCALDEGAGGIPMLGAVVLPDFGCRPGGSDGESVAGDGLAFRVPGVVATADGDY